MFREAVLAFLGVKKGSIDPKEKYCQTCKKVGMSDCENCTKDIRIGNA